MKILTSILLVLALGLGGCSYKLVRYDGALGDLQTVAIAPLENNSYEAGLELMLSDAFLQEFLRRKALRVIDDPGQADLVLEGKIQPVRTAQRSFSSVVLVLEYEVGVTLDLQAILRDGSELPLDQAVLHESEIYLASADHEATRKNREEALRRISAVLAGRVHDILYEQYQP